MNILVTGGAGFIGSHLVRVLLHENQQVTVLDNLSTGSRENLPEHGFTFWQLDIRDPGLTARLSAGHFDAIIHLAAQTMVNASVRDPLFDASENILGFINLLEAARYNGIRRIILASSAAIYGDVDETDLPVEESHTNIPLSFYGLTKQTAEKYVKLYHRFFGLEYIIFRFANVYGERQGNIREGGVISTFIKQLIADQAPTIFGDGEQTRDFIYAGDIANGLFQGLYTQKANTAYNLSTQTETSLNTLLSLLESFSGKTIQPIRKSLLKGDIRRSILSNDKAKHALNWHPEVTLKEGLLRTYFYFSQQQIIRMQKA